MSVQLLRGFQLPIIDRYISQEVIRAFVAIVAVLFLVLLSQGFIKLLQRVVSGDFSNDVLMTMIGLHSVRVISHIMPPAFFFAILYAIGRFHKDSEITAMAACGLGPVQIYRSIFIMAIPMALVVGWLSIYGVPTAKRMQWEIIRAQEQIAEFGNATAGRFNELQDGNLVTYVEEFSKDKQEMQKVFVHSQKQGKVSLITAPRGYHEVDEATGERYIVLEKAHRVQGVPGKQDFSIAKMERYGLRVLKKEEGQGRPMGREERPWGELVGSDNIRDRVELQDRLMLPVAVLVFALISFPISHFMSRTGYGYVVMAFLFYFMFWNLQTLSAGWMQQGLTPVWMGRWWVHLVVLLFGGLLFLITSQPFKRKSA